jgi:hypothetical protein
VRPDLGTCQAHRRLERLLRVRLDDIGSAPRALFLHVLKLPGHERARRIGEFYGDSKT